MRSKSILVLVNGVFPTHPLPLEALSTIRPILCTDGAVAGLLDYGMTPDYVIGDMDSRPATLPDAISQIPVLDQSDSDFEKALQWCLERKYDHITILGISGKREDHTLANLLSLLPWCERFTLRCITDTATIFPLNRYGTFTVATGQTVSLLAPDSTAEITTTGLHWDLQKKTIASPTMGISNRAERETITITTDRPILVFLIHSDYPV